MSRSERYRTLEDRETHAVRPRTLAERRAAVEDELRVAYAAGDRERVSELRVRGHTERR
jgi:hypothetical protein